MHRVLAPHGLSPSSRERVRPAVFGYTVVTVVIAPAEAPSTRLSTDRPRTRQDGAEYRPRPRPAHGFPRSSSASCSLTVSAYLGSFGRLTDSLGSASW